MSTKTISIMDDVYKLLVLNKIGEESFSDVIRRILTRKNNLIDLAGSMKSLGEREAREIKKDIMVLREKSTKELYFK